MNISELSWEFIAVFGGVQAVLTGLLGFLGKMWLGRTLQSEKTKLEAMVEKSLYMQKVQFDTEFQIYSQLWEELCNVRNTIENISWHRERHTDPRKSSYEEKCKNYYDSVTSLKSLVESKRPFYSAEIANLLFEMIDLADKERKRDECFRAERGMGSLFLVTPEGVENLVKLKLMSGKICETIRTRLTGTSIT